MKSIATIGTFDGVHLGHRMVVSTLLRLAREEGLRPLVFAFANHPLDVIAPERRPERLQDADRQQTMLRDCGVEVVPIYFDRQMMRMTSKEYMQMLRDQYGVETIVMGYDNRFGHDTDSDIEVYRQNANTLGMRLIVAPELPGVSSSAIRRMLRRGEVEQAAKALGYPYSISGKVVHGRELGRTIGFPTANLEPTDPHRLVPADGVYACLVTLPDGERFAAMTNIGHRPTIRDGRDCRSIEVHIIGMDRDLYGDTLTLTFIRRLREEMKMPSLDALRQRLEQDRQETLTTIKNYRNKLK